MREELKEYYDILCNGDYPDFLNKYCNVKELNRLKDVGQFCGCDYTKLHNIKYWYSRFDHSVAVALITWNFTHDKEQTLVALYHDLGTPAFAHSIDFLLGDSVEQSSSEKNIFDIINKSDDIKKLLEEDNINIEIFSDYKKYPIIKNEIPQLCADRLDGILPTNFIWLQTWKMDKVRKVYNDIKVLVNEFNEEEIGFTSIEAAELFDEGIFNYSIALQSNEDKFSLQCISDFLKELIDQDIINLDQLYNTPEKEIVNILDESFGGRWEAFKNAKELVRVDSPVDKYHCVGVESKKRYVKPLVQINENCKSVRLNEISVQSEERLAKFLDFQDSKYCYVRELKKF